MKAKILFLIALMACFVSCDNNMPTNDSFEGTTWEGSHLLTDITVNFLSGSNVNMHFGKYLNASVEGKYFLEGSFIKIYVKDIEGETYGYLSENSVITANLDREGKYMEVIAETNGQTFDFVLTKVND